MNLKIIEERLRREHSLPEAFYFYRYAWQPAYGEPIYCEFEGAECPVFTRGPKKGKPNYRKKVNVRMFAVTVAQAGDWEDEWEAETGKCSNCLGEGRVVSKWSKAGGTEWRVCKLCNGRGKLTTERERDE